MNVLIVIVIVFLCFSVFAIWAGKKDKFSISFMETFNLTEMPIITMFAGNTKVNFLLDTGATQSFIAQSVSNLVTGKESTYSMEVISAQGTEESNCKIIDTVLTYKDRDFDVKLIVNSSLDTSFKDLKVKKGIILHGILGSDFLDRYSYIIDFEKYLAYPKK
jgi:hypothetical protein